MRTLNVVTAAGDFDEIHNKVDINTKINKLKIHFSFFIMIK